MTVDVLQWMYDSGQMTVELIMSKENDEEEMENQRGEGENKT